MYLEPIIRSVEHNVRARCEGEASGHDWWHIHRVRNTALTIGREEGADLFVVELAALLHDIADWKFTGGDDTVGPRVAREVMTEHKVSDDVIGHVCDIIATLSYKGAGVTTPMATIEGMVVQDADRLDALGAIGIARAFAYGGFKQRVMHDPNVRPTMHASKDAYKNAVGTTVNHFYEKLLLLKDRMNTNTGRRMAGERHDVIEKYLAQFFAEWEGER